MEGERGRRREAVEVERGRRREAEREWRVREVEGERQRRRESTGNRLAPAHMSRQHFPVEESIPECIRNT